MTRPEITTPEIGPGFWAEGLLCAPDFPVLQTSQSVDVAVVGGGYTGLSCALSLAEQGLSVALLEAQSLGQGASGANGGQASAAPRLAPETLEARLGLEEARQFWRLHLGAMAHLRRLIERHGIDCDWRPGVLQLARSQRQADRLQRRAERLQREYGCGHYRFLPSDLLGEYIDSPRYCAGLLDGASGHLHPLKLLLGLAEAANSQGALIYQRSPVASIARPGERFVLHCNGAQLEADQLVLACNADQGLLDRRLAGACWPLCSFMLATEPLPDDLAEQLLGRSLAAFDLDYLPHYWKRSSDNRLLFGGADSAAPGPEVRTRLASALQAIYPQLAGVAIEQCWGGRFALSLNRLPQLGQLEPGLYYAQGYSGDGLTLGCYAGQLLGEAISGSSAEFEQLAVLPQPRWPGAELVRRWLLPAVLDCARFIDKR